MQAGSRITNHKDFAAGVFYVLVGGAFAIGALNYNIGSAARMGPGWFPLAVGVLLVAVGLLTLLGSLRKSAEPERIKLPHLSTIFWILGAVILFGLLLPILGLVLSLMILVIVSSLASHEFTWKGALTGAVVLTVFSVGVFIEGIDLLIPLWPSFIR